MRRGTSVLSRAKPLALVMLVLASAAGIGMFAGNGTAAQAATKYTVFAGGGRGGISVDIFRPEVINVIEGDSVEFNNPYEEIHTVTYLAGQKVPDIISLANPIPGLRGPPRLQFDPKTTTPVPARGAAKVDGTAFQNSGILAKGSTWTANFTKTGSFQMICIVHPITMTLTVNVLSPGTYVNPQEVLNREADRLLSERLARAEAAYAAASVTRTTAANGTTNWESPFVNLPGIAIQRFVPGRLQINVGDSVTWKNDKPGPPHTITFGEPPAPEPGEVDPILPNAVSYPVKPSQNFDGTARYVNSGIVGLPPEGIGGSSFSLTFTRPGTYQYICVLHIDQGMAGVVVVGDGAGSGGPGIPPGLGGAIGGAIGGGLGGPGGPGGPGAVRPPSTGDAGLATNSGMNTWLMAGVGVLFFGLGGVAMAWSRLRN